MAGARVIYLFPSTVQQIGLSQWIVALILALLATDYMRRLLRRHLDGYTGDGLGATQQVSEIAIYAGLAVSAPFV
ncbi:adenosylcobinamide-GDP ribazoletransferase [uncultured Psychrobacter sp.]|uniref:adenosylcobinamide-GDP ribazoletransferase n=1 Tax=uncultured Psychrobacter sp. TaxID=259303 RepID=UPI0025981F19|nr:adenosylcobinamide-GDP ribazoletransferase [uncultured Psychrobacter sp.]